MKVAQNSPLVPRLCSGLTGEQKRFQGELQLFPHLSLLLNDAIVSGMLEKLYSQDNMELGTAGQGPSELARLASPVQVRLLCSTCAQPGSPACIASRVLSQSGFNPGDAKVTRGLPFLTCNLGTYEHGWGRVGVRVREAVWDTSTCSGGDGSCFWS